MKTENEILEGEVVEAPKRKRRTTKKVLIKDKMFQDAYLRNNCDATKAAFEVTGATTRDSAAVMGSELLKRNKEAIEARMEKYGLTEEKVIKRHKDLIESPAEAIAMKAVDTYYKVTKKEGESAGNIHIQFHF